MEGKGCAGNSSATTLEAVNRRRFVIISADSTTGGVVEWKKCDGNCSATSMGGGDQYSVEVL
jgi:hypothetical protein